jgi:hyaluronan synthase
MAFNQERAAQSFFKVLMCCSGPFSAYRGNIFRGLMHKYTSQTFFGKVCTYGDDRHLTNLVLEEGWNVVYNKDAEAFTHVPTTLQGYLKQQLRWNKSFYREMLWTLKAVTKHNAYLIYDLAMQFILPFLLIGALVHTAYVAAFIDGKVLFAYFGIMLGVSLLRVTYGLIRTKDLGFYWFLVYGLFHVTVLIPTRFLALATLNDGKWGTRG